jgi:hypothetical protein
MNPNTGLFTATPNIFPVFAASGPSYWLPTNGLTKALRQPVKSKNFFLLCEQNIMFAHLKVKAHRASANRERRAFAL